MQQTMHDFLINIFGLKPVEENTNSKLDDVMNLIIGLRKEAKTKKDFATSDAIRNKLVEAGIQLKDEKDGTVSYSMT
jgi:cysteinyl-tRNA synthetase